VALEQLDHPILMDGPIENEVVFLGRHQNGTVVVRVAQLLDLVRFHEEFAVALSIGGQEHVQSLGVCNIEDLPVVGEIETNDIFGVLFDYLGGFEAFEGLLV